LILAKNLSTSAKVGEKLAQQCTALPRQNPLPNRQSVIEARVAHQVPKTATKTGLWVSGAKNQSGESSIYQSSCAHRAGLQGHDHLASFESPAAHASAGIRNRLEFRMSQRAAAGLAVIETAPQLLAFPNHYGSDRNFSQVPRSPGELEGPSHPKRLFLWRHVCSRCGLVVRQGACRVLRAGVV